MTDPAPDESRRCLLCGTLIECHPLATHSSLSCNELGWNLRRLLAGWSVGGPRGDRYGNVAERLGAPPKGGGPLERPLETAGLERGEGP